MYPVVPSRNLHSRNRKNRQENIQGVTFKKIINLIGCDIMEGPVYYKLILKSLSISKAFI